jgi:hypothetical protein
MKSAQLLLCAIEAVLRCGLDPATAPDEGVESVCTLGRELTELTEAVERSAGWWTAPAPLQVDGYPPCANTPEVILRVAWRTWHTALVAASHDAVVSPPDRQAIDGDVRTDLRKHWQIVSALLRRLPPFDAGAWQARLRQEFVAGRDAFEKAMPYPAARSLPPVRPMFEEGIAAYMALPEQWANMDANARLAALSSPPPRCAGGTPPGAEDPPPNGYLLSWAEVLDALGQGNNDTKRNQVRQLNDKYGGPIIFTGQGAQPKVAKNKLLYWWNGLEQQFEEDAQRRRDAQATVKEQHLYGQGGTVVPDISGSVKKRRRKNA